jgi:hypothetical protein
MKCLPERFDLWDLYADYCPKGVFGCLYEAKFCWVRGLFHHIGPMERRYVGLKNYLDTLLLMVIICGGFILQFCLNASNSSSSRLFRPGRSWMQAAAPSS